MAHARAHIGTVDFLTTIETGGRTLTADEPEALGGGNAGFAPYDLLLASLAACTCITLRMYAAHKGWPLEAIDVELHHSKDDKRSKITRLLTLKGALDEAQRARLAEVVERTPVTLTLKEGADITTTFG
ncbi:OsmC family protein [Asticcacaulis excentricus]|uniref:OsmC family protein n=1 Tax=Asticcacaulis excentricus (strain ATCC 15261 / DSM 4724 / KCTC 12464 / NCIMB 9791 / VKM B-1370 / CB 48) TaxID=573065 RepID=E8RQI5_ASTEC|nr:OsmC family protein [Asticcacaulis excentricus]ADU12169.1 OsmC family protein [Asticcacaulis excentricus CB 48]